MQSDKRQNPFSDITKGNKERINNLSIFLIISPWFVFIDIQATTRDIGT